MSELNTRYLGFDPQLVDYAEAFALQQSLHQQVLADEQPSTLLLLEHVDVYTAGRRTEAEDRPQDGTPVVDVDRGGKITWHGRGQLVGYPILKLVDKSLVKPYVCALEGAIIAVLDRLYGISGTRVEGRSGVWLTDGLQDRKIAAIGIRVHRGVTTHGFALNCSNELSAFEQIIPCGIRGVGTTSISAELGRRVTPQEVAEPIAQELALQLDRYIAHRPDPAAGAADMSAGSMQRGAC